MRADDSGETAAGGTANRRLTLFDLWKQTTARLDLLLAGVPVAGFPVNVPDLPDRRMP